MFPGRMSLSFGSFCWDESSSCFKMSHYIERTSWVEKRGTSRRWTRKQQRSWFMCPKRSPVLTADGTFLPRWGCDNPWKWTHFVATVTSVGQWSEDFPGWQIFRKQMTYKFVERMWILVTFVTSGCWTDGSTWWTWMFPWHCPSTFGSCRSDSRVWKIIQSANPAPLIKLSWKSLSFQAVVFSKCRKQRQASQQHIKTFIHNK